MKCVCVGSGWNKRRGGEWMRGLGLGFTNPVETRGWFDVCLCLGCCGVGGVGEECVGVLEHGLEESDGVISEL